MSGRLDYRPRRSRLPGRRPQDSLLRLLRIRVLACCVLAAVASTVPLAVRARPPGSPAADSPTLAQLMGAPGIQPAATGARGAGAAPAVAPAVAPLRQRQRLDVLIQSPTSLPTVVLARLASLAGAPERIAVVRRGWLRLGAERLVTLGVEPGRFRAFAPRGTAESDAVWRAVAQGELIASRATVDRLWLRLGGHVWVGPAGQGGAGQSAPRQDTTDQGGGGRSAARRGTTDQGAGGLLRIGAIAATGLPGVDLVVADAVAAAYRLPAATDVLLSAGPGGDPGALASAARAVAGRGALVRQLTTASYRPPAVIRGGPAARPLGSFTYRYSADGTISPDPTWVSANIRTESVPILGPVTCHRLVFGQLRAALADVQRAGLAGSIHPGEYAGCYNPRFIDHDPQEPISLHTWGIALDLNVPGNQRGTVGQIDRRVVAIFKHWGFAWGGDWSYTDPMHFELATLLRPDTAAPSRP